MHAERLVQQCLARERFHASRAVRFNLRQCEAHDRKYTTNYLCTKTDFVCLCKLNGWFSSVLLCLEGSRLTVYATLVETVSRLPQETHSNYFSRRPRTTGYGRNCKSRPDHSWEHLAAYRRTDHRNSCASNLKEIVEMTVSTFPNHRSGKQLWRLSSLLPRSASRSIFLQTVGLSVLRIWKKSST